MKKPIYWRIMGIVVLLVLVAFLGQPLTAGPANVPGSATDPLVSKSYVEQALQEKVYQLEQQVATLSQRAETLRAALNALEKTAGLPLTPAASVIPPPTPPPASPSSPPSSTTPPPATKTGKTTDPGTRVRTGPGTSYSLVVELAKDTTVTVLGEQSGWYNVRLKDGRTGWIRKDLVQLQ